MVQTNNLTFLENVLDRDFYVTKKSFAEPKEPLRVMVTDAGDKIACNLIYKICSGEVFGPDQEVILHLNNSRGTLYHKDLALELSECGFPCYKDFVVSCNPSVIYKNLDYVVFIATYEEIPGWAVSGALTYQMLKARQVATFIMNFAKPDCKVILAGPATKALACCLGTFKMFAPSLKEENVTCVTCLDVFISKAELAAKLKTTTNRIKNVVIWNCTYPDTANATVHMFPPDDLGNIKMEDIPISQAVDDSQWLHNDFKMRIFRRVINRDLLKWGKAVAAATAHHLRVLYFGTESFDEIQSMGTISTPGIGYAYPHGRGFSFPVKVKNGKVEVLQNVEVDPSTYLNRLRHIYSFTDSYVYNSSLKILAFLSDYESCTKEHLLFPNAVEQTGDGWEKKTWFNKYIITPSPAEEVPVAPKEHDTSKKSIVWMTKALSKESDRNRRKSSIKINLEQEKRKQLKKGNCE